MYANSVAVPEAADWVDAPIILRVAAELAADFTPGNLG
jgi:hypothetical protein